MLLAVHALLPVFFIILIGYCLLRLDFPHAGFWSHMERLTYFLLFPALLISNLSSVTLNGPRMLPLILAPLLATALLAAVLLCLRPYLPLNGSAFSSLFQATVRFNTYIAIALVITLYGDASLMLVAVIIAVMVPVVNVMCVLVLSHFASHHPAHWQQISRTLIRNPLILACLTGIAVNLSALPVPVVIQETLTLLGRAALPLGLLAVGTGLRFGQLRNDLPILLFSAMLKLLILPLLTWVFCQLLNADEAVTQAAVLFSALPTATSSYILARQMGGDHVLMANLVTLQTLLAMITLPLLPGWLG